MTILLTILFLPSLQQELAECQSNQIPGLTITLPSEANLQTWHVLLTGPDNTPYRGGTFGLIVQLPDDYPFKAPVVTFHTRIYHPNVTNDSAGNICISALKPENWKPASKLSQVLEAVRQLLVEPNPDDPLEARIADEYRSQRGEFDKFAKEYTDRFAKKKDPFAA